MWLYVIYLLKKYIYFLGCNSYKLLPNQAECVRVYTHTADSKLSVSVSVDLFMYKVASGLTKLDNNHCRGQ